MYFSFKGTIKYVAENYIALEVNNIAYQIYVANPSKYQIGSNTTLFIYQVIREDECYFVGFSSLEERSAFLILLRVNGIGPKTAISILKHSSSKDLLNAIRSNNINYLKRIPGVGTKGAQQILLDLRGTLDIKNLNPHQYEEAKEALKSLKFKLKDIDSVLAEISIPGASNEVILREALIRLNSRNVSSR